MNYFIRSIITCLFMFLCLSWRLNSKKSCISKICQRPQGKDVISNLDHPNVRFKEKWKTGQIKKNFNICCPCVGIYICIGIFYLLYRTICVPKPGKNNTSMISSMRLFHRKNTCNFYLLPFWFNFTADAQYRRRWINI